jgi:nucleotide-binding universal stress UspA family protein
MEFASLFQSSVHLVTVVPPVFSETAPYVPTTLEGEGNRDAVLAGFQEYLDAMGKPIREAGIPSRSHVVDQRGAAEGILEHRDRIGADLVVMSSRGRGGVVRLVLGSVADKVIRSLPVPILIQPQPRE